MPDKATVLCHVSSCYNRCMILSITHMLREWMRILDFSPNSIQLSLSSAGGGMPLRRALNDGRLQSQKNKKLVATAQAQ